MAEQRALAFSGLKVLDFGMFWAGPYAGMFLGANGADVVKVESAGRPDSFRFINVVPEGEQWYETSSLFQWTNMNKRAVALDLGRPEGAAAARALAREADVVIENFSPRVMEQFGLSYADLARENPRLVMIRMPAFGLSGPWRDYLGWASVFEQIAGMASTTGYPDDKPVTPGGYLDPIVGMHAIVAIVAALEERDRSGQGQLIELAQIEASVALTADQVIGYTVSGDTATRTGNRSSRHVPQGVWRAQDGTWVAVSVTSDDGWARVVEAVADPALRGSELRDRAGRRAAEERLEQALGRWIGEHPGATVAETLRGDGVAAVVVVDPARPHHDPQLLWRRQFETWTHPVVGDRLYMGWPMRSDDRPHHRSVAPTLGQHNDEVLAEAGLSEQEIARLRESGVIGERYQG